MATATVEPSALPAIPTGGWLFEPNVPVTLRSTGESATPAFGDWQAARMRPASNARVPGEVHGAAEVSRAGVAPLTS
ncbi:hypothetical protein [Actinoplanes sp. NPDC026619]|uniref:hypothetical protein n=1 Tax=Actinoplanes sp. NPDC026619 TaxID=3155798 RepID=UPI0033E07DC6